MSGRTFTTQRGDYGRPIIFDASYDDPSLSLSDDITMSTSVVFLMGPREPGTPLTINRLPALVVSSANGVVRLRFNFAHPHLDTPGTYDAQFEAAPSGGAVTGPTLGRINVVIDPDMG